MIDYTVVYRQKRKTVSAANPLSACNKAFHVRGWHWEYSGSDETMTARVYQCGIEVAHLRLQDNG